MARKKWINKNAPTTQTYQLLYRSQDDPLLNEDSTGDRALFAVPGKNSQLPAISSNSSRPKALHIADLEDDLDFSSMRENEGEAAEYGIYFDDTSYDYMQHLRELNDGGDGDSHYVEAIPTTVRGKGKGKAHGGLSLDEAIRQIDLNDEEEAPDLIDSSASAMSRTLKASRRLEAQQDIPDEIAGFQPDMDPRLREALEALDDEEYMDEADEDDVFGALGLDGKHNGELEIDDFTLTSDQLEDDGWESDVTEKASAQSRHIFQTDEPSLHPASPAIEEAGLTSAQAQAAVAEDGDWLASFAKYKREQSSKQIKPPGTASIIAGSDINSGPPTLYTLNGTPLRQKKRKGALTNPSAYSMTSSSLNRGAGLQLLDRRFDQVEKLYSIGEAADVPDDDLDGRGSVISGMTGMSNFSTLSTKSFANEKDVRQDFNGMMDNFLDGWDKGHPGGGPRKGAKGKRGKNGNEVYGLQQLDEVRRELGPARIIRKAAKT